MVKRNEIEKILLGLAIYYGESLPEKRAELFVNALEDLDLSDIARAATSVMRDPKFTRMPWPAQLRAKINSEGDAEGMAVDAASRIVESLHRFGYSNPDKAYAHIGELGWKVVERQGGWQNLCENTLLTELPILRAQWRELAKAIYSRTATGVADVAPPLPPGPGGRPKLSLLVSKIGKEL